MTTFKKILMLDPDTKERLTSNKHLYVQLRVFKVGTHMELNLPKYGMVKLNNKVIKTLTQPPENTSARKRKDFPINLTEHLKEGSNELEIVVNNDKEE